MREIYLFAIMFFVIIGISYSQYYNVEYSLEYDGIAKKVYVFSIQNLEDVENNFSLAVFFIQTNTNIDKIILYLQNITQKNFTEYTYEDVINYYTVNDINTSLPENCWWINETTYACSEKVISGSYEVTKNVLEFVPYKITEYIDENGARIFKYGNITLPPYGSECLYDDFGKAYNCNGTVIIKVEFEFNVIKNGHGWGSEGIIGIIDLITGEIYHPWWNTYWTYRIPITIDNTQNPNDLYDYQVLITVDTASLVSAGKMRSDLGDIRFTYYDETSNSEIEIPYWIEPTYETTTEIPQGDDDLNIGTRDADCSLNPTFKYYYCAHPCEPTGWYKIDYDDSSWNVGVTPFAGVTRNSNFQFACTDILNYAPDDLFVRKEFYLTSLPKFGKLYLAYDDGIRCYLNENLIIDALNEAHGPSYWNKIVDIPGNYFRLGKNVLACWVANGGENSGTGPGALDLKLEVTYVTYVSESTKIWVKVPLIPANGYSKIYMYYGNPDALSESNGDAVFEFFDDFLGTSLDTSKWISYGTVTVSNGIVTVSNSGFNVGAGLSTVQSFNQLNTRVIAKLSFTPAGLNNWDNLFYHSTSVSLRRDSYDPYGTGPTNYQRHYIFLTGVSSKQTSYYFDLPVGQWIRIEGRFLSNSACYIVDNYVSSSSGTDTVCYSGSISYSSGNYGMRLVSYPTSGTEIIQIDYFFIAKYTYLEPTFSLGSEESYIAYYIEVDFGPGWKEIRVIPQLTPGKTYLLSPYDFSWDKYSCYINITTNTNVNVKIALGIVSQNIFLQELNFDLVDSTGKYSFIRARAKGYYYVALTTAYSEAEFNPSESPILLDYIEANITIPPGYSPGSYVEHFYICVFRSDLNTGYCPSL